MPWAPGEPNGSEQGDNCLRVYIREGLDTYRFVLLVELDADDLLEQNGMIHIAVIHGFQDLFAKLIKQPIQNRWNGITGLHLVAAQSG